VWNQSNKVRDCFTNGTVHWKMRKRVPEGVLAWQAPFQISERLLLNIGTWAQFQISERLPSKFPLTRKWKFAGSNRAQVRDVARPLHHSKSSGPIAGSWMGSELPDCCPGERNSYVVRISHFRAQERIQRSVLVFCGRELASQRRSQSCEKAGQVSESFSLLLLSLSEEMSGVRDQHVNHFRFGC
jgi:hypothetical protein